MILYLFISYRLDVIINSILLFLAQFPLSYPPLSTWLLVKPRDPQENLEQKLMLGTTGKKKIKIFFPTKK